MSPTPKLCKHGILGKSKCRKCLNEIINRWRTKHPNYTKEEYWTKHPGKNVKICPHGIKGKSHCKQCLKQYREKWRKTKYVYNPEKRQQEYHRNLKKIKARTTANRPRQKAREQKERARIKKAVMDHYGGKCSCCGESDIDFLTIGHVNDDGTQHRLEIGSGARFYKKLLKANFVTSYKLTVECYNCNYGKRINHGVCPHKKQVHKV